MITSVPRYSLAERDRRWGLAREMGRRRMAVPVILTSGFGGVVTQRLAAADLPFLRKPYRIDALRQTINAALCAPGNAALRAPGALPQDGAPT